MSENDQKLDRRQFLINAGCAGLFAAGATTLGSGCKKGGSGGGGSEGGGGGNESTSQGQKEADKGGGSGELSCTDTSGLKDGEIKTRNNLNYVDDSPKKDKNCANCQLYEPPEKEGTCGGCKSVPGPIHPEGYCTAWVKKA